MGTINMSQLPCSPPKNFLLLFLSPYSIPFFFFFFTLILYFLNSLLLSTVTSSLSPHIPLLSCPRQNRPVCLMSWTSCPLFCWQPSGPCVLETAWHCWDTGYRTSFPRWDPFHNGNHIHWKTQFPGRPRLKKQTFLNVLTQWSLRGQQHTLTVLL